MYLYIIDQSHDRCEVHHLLVCTCGTILTESLSKSEETTVSLRGAQSQHNTNTFGVHN